MDNIEKKKEENRNQQKDLMEMRLSSVVRDLAVQFTPQLTIKDSSPNNNIEVADGNSTSNTEIVPPNSNNSDWFPQRVDLFERIRDNAAKVDEIQDLEDIPVHCLNTAKSHSHLQSTNENMIKAVIHIDNVIVRDQSLEESLAAVVQEVETNSSNDDSSYEAIFVPLESIAADPDLTSSSAPSCVKGDSESLADKENPHCNEKPILSPSQVEAVGDIVDTQEIFLDRISMLKVVDAGVDNTLGCKKQPVLCPSAPEVEADGEIKHSPETCLDNVSAVKDIDSGVEKTTGSQKADVRSQLKSNEEDPNICETFCMKGDSESSVDKGKPHCNEKPILSPSQVEAVGDIVDTQEIFLDRISMLKVVDAGVDNTLGCKKQPVLCPSAPEVEADGEINHSPETCLDNVSAVKDIDSGVEKTIGSQKADVRSQLKSNEEDPNICETFCVKGDSESSVDKGKPHCNEKPILSPSQVEAVGDIVDTQEIFLDRISMLKVVDAGVDNTLGCKKQPVLCPSAPEVEADGEINHSPETCLDNVSAVKDIDSGVEKTIGSQKADVRSQLKSNEEDPNSCETPDKIPSMKHDNHDLNITVENGTGERLELIPRIASEVMTAHDEILNMFHSILFDIPGSCENEVSKALTQNNILRFSGFPFDENSEKFRMKTMLVSRMTLKILRLVCNIVLGVRIKKKAEVLPKTLAFLLKPHCEFDSDTKERKEKFLNVNKEQMQESEEFRESRIVLRRLSKEDIQRYTEKPTESSNSTPECLSENSTQKRTLSPKRKLTENSNSTPESLSENSTQKRTLSPKRKLTERSKSTPESLSENSTQKRTLSRKRKLTESSNSTPESLSENSTQKRTLSRKRKLTERSNSTPESLSENSTQKRTLSRKRKLTESSNSTPESLSEHSTQKRTLSPKSKLTESSNSTPESLSENSTQKRTLSRKRKLTESSNSTPESLSEHSTQKRTLSPKRKLTESSNSTPESLSENSTQKRTRSHKRKLTESSNTTPERLSDSLEYSNSTPKKQREGNIQRTPNEKRSVSVSRSSKTPPVDTGCIEGGPEQGLTSFPGIVKNLKRASNKTVLLLHILMYGDVEEHQKCKKNILKFSGSAMSQNVSTEERSRFLHYQTETELKVMCGVLNVDQRDCNKSAMVSRLLEFLQSPSAYLMKQNLPSQQQHYSQPAKYGGGKPLWCFDKIRSNIKCSAPEDLKELCDVLFCQPCENSEIHEKILGFSGFSFGEHSQELRSRKILMHYMDFSSIKKIASVLDLLSLTVLNGSREYVTDIILKFLLKPNVYTKVIPSRTCLTKDNVLLNEHSSIINKETKSAGETKESELNTNLRQ